MSTRPPRGPNRERDDGSADAAERPAARTARAGALLVLALLAVPMAVISAGGDLTVVSLWGFLDAGPESGGALGGYPVWRDFLDQPRPYGALPPSIRAWPLAIGFHLLAAGSAAIGAALGREDRRVTGGLLVLAAAASLWVSVGLAARFGVGTTVSWLTVVPIGAVVTLAVAALAYGRDLRRVVAR
ncbi:TIGR04206 family protein [Halorubrum sp. AD140]|uniref:TIGR04206 family protein n=1 Tax=Halorubrum sp. AD140 TaxID=3050073 RepID=UPI002ACCB2B9|nr:TIGR04206 family protein [Halorubrum sp. AD140]MDZ5811555.1 TIGR04206 family protein [Halorubrum sp. AD140]